MSMLFGDDNEVALSSRCRLGGTPSRNSNATMVVPLFGPSSPSSPSGGTMSLPRSSTPSFKVGPSRASLRHESPRQKPSPLTILGDGEGFWPPTPMSASQSSRAASPPRISPLAGSAVSSTPQRINIESIVSPSSMGPTSTRRHSEQSSLYSSVGCGTSGYLDAQSAARHGLMSSPQGVNGGSLQMLSSIGSSPQSVNGGSLQMPSSIGSCTMTSRSVGSSVTLHASTEVSFRCPVCGQQFQDAESAAMHCRAAESAKRDVREESPGAAYSHQSPNVRSTTSYSCPRCNEKGFADAQSAAQHCWQTLGTASFSPPSSRAQASNAYRPKSGSPIRRSSWARTPPSADHFRSHPKRYSVDSNGGGMQQGMFSGVCRTLSMPSGKVFEGDLVTDPAGYLQHFLSPSSARRQRKIERHVDQDTGIAQTIVHNADGTCTAFGESSVCSLVESEEIEAKKLIDSLNDFELQGLVHELNQRLLKTAGDYEALQKELERFAELCDLAFFGLDETSTEKDLDRAYRKMARKLHPDKNGNTEEAKIRFQDMKDRYERLKKKFKRQKEQEEANGEKEAKKETMQTSKEFAPNCAVPGTLPTEPIELPDAGSSMDQGSSGVDQEELDRDKLDDACWRILRRTKAFVGKVNHIHQQIDDTKKELEDLRQGKHLGC